MTSSDDEQRMCPTCEEHTADQYIQSQGFVIGAALAQFDTDSDLIRQYTANATGFDFHVAVRMFMDYLEVTAALAGMSLYDALEKTKAAVSEAQAQPDS